MRRVDLATGAVIEICRTPGFGVGGAWMDDGTILFGMITSGLMRVPSSGGTPTLLTHLNAEEGERNHISPQALPGGRFMYLAQHEARENNTIEAAKLDDPDKRTRLVTSGYSALYASGYLLFLHGSTLMAQAFDPAASRLSGDPAPLAETFTGLIPSSTPRFRPMGSWFTILQAPRISSSGLTGEASGCTPSASRPFTGRPASLWTALRGDAGVRIRRRHGPVDHRCRTRPSPPPDIRCQAA